VTIRQFDSSTAIKPIKFWYLAHKETTNSSNRSASRFVADLYLKHPGRRIDTVAAKYANDGSTATNSFKRSSSEGRGGVHGAMIEIDELVVADRPFKLCRYYPKRPSVNPCFVNVK
jgi:hypothetical protein